MTGPTPGPWFVNADGVVTADDSGPWRDIIADVYACPLEGKNQQANTRLIAAAPELLEALGLLLGEYEKAVYALLDFVQGTPVEEWPDALTGSRAHIERAAEVLAKARGES